MTSKERVRRTILRQNPDRVPANFSGTGYVKERLMKHYGYNDFEQVLSRLQIDIRDVSPDYIGAPLPEDKDVWGCTLKKYWTGTEWYAHEAKHPLEDCETLEDLKNAPWPSPDDYDYESVKHFCAKHEDKAISIGYTGVFQICCSLRGMDNLFVDMIEEPEMAHYVVDRMTEFELEYYERMLIAGDGQIDLLRTCDDYGTQRGLLFNVEMWKEYYQKNLKKLVDLAHRYDAFYLQHSCGAIRDIIPELIGCGIDVLDPVQKVVGMVPQELKAAFGNQLTFQGGVDTQDLLPNATAAVVAQETKQIIDTLYDDGGYILMASQGLQRDVPLENIEAMFGARWQ